MRRPAKPDLTPPGPRRGAGQTIPEGAAAVSKTLAADSGQSAVGACGVTRRGRNPPQTVMTLAYVHLPSALLPLVGGGDPWPATLCASRGNPVRFVRRAGRTDDDRKPVLATEPRAHVRDDRPLPRKGGRGGA